MSNAAIAMDGQAAITPTALSWKYIHWGLGLFITGFLTGFIPILHYMHGAVAGDVGPVFLKNMTLWWGCPAILAELTLKTGGLGMIAIGLCYLAIIRQGASPDMSKHERLAPTLCSYGLVATLVSAGAGYVICNIFWPNFLAELLLSARTDGEECVACGAGTQHHRLCNRHLLCVCRHPQSVGPNAMTHLSGNLPAGGSSMTHRNLDAITQLSEPPLLRQLWERTTVRVMAWCGGIAAGALWIYSGMPMICH